MAVNEDGTVILVRKPSTFPVRGHSRSSQHWLSLRRRHQAREG